MKKHLLALVLLAACQAHALDVVGDLSVSAPYTRTDRVNITGNLILNTPGSYSATDWNILGNVRFAAAGVYTFSATAGSIRAVGNVTGPTTGTVTVTVNYTTRLDFLGNIAANVTTIDGPNQPTPPSGTAGSAPLVNISTRATLTTGQVLTPGFVVGGSTSRRVLIRAIGPGLTAFGVSGVATAPTLAVFNGAGVQIATNTRWGGGAALASVFAGVGAFVLAPTSADSAVLLTLAPGNYTARVSGIGEVLAEIYFVD